MRTRITLLASAVVLMVGMLGAARPAAAAPPQPYHYGDCVEYVVDSARYEYCYEFQGVEMLVTPASGVTTYSDRGTLSETLTINGEVVESEVEEYTYMGVSKDGEPILARERGGGSVSYVDPLTGETITCTYGYTFLDTKMHGRHNVSHAECM